MSQAAGRANDPVRAFPEQANPGNKEPYVDERLGDHSRLALASGGSHTACWKQGLRLPEPATRLGLPVTLVQGEQRNQIE